MLTLFGSIAISIMMLSYTLEARSTWFVTRVRGGIGCHCGLQCAGRGIPDYGH